MLPTFMTKKAIPQKPDPPPSGRVERVMLARFLENLRPIWYKEGVIEDYIGDEVVVRFGNVVIQVPAEMLVPADDR